MANTIAPGYVKTRYSGVTFDHWQKLAVEFSGTPTPGTMPNFLANDGSTVLAADTALAAWYTHFNNIYSSDTTFGYYEIHAVDPDTLVDQFIFAGNLDIAGDGEPNTNVQFSRLTLSYKTRLGNPLRIIAMESNRNFNIEYDPGALDSQLAAINDYLLGDTCFIRGYDNSPAFALLRGLTKCDDVLRGQYGL